MRHLTLWISATLLLIAPVMASAQASPRVSLDPRTPVYAGPGQQYPEVVYLQRSERVQLYGCLQDYAWCDVGVLYSSRGWAWRGWVRASDINLLHAQRAYRLHQSHTDLPWFAYPLIGFAFNDYWASHYRYQPWYAQRQHWQRWDWQRHNARHAWSADHRQWQRERYRDRRDWREDRRDDRRDWRSEHRNERRDWREDSRDERRDDRRYDRRQEQRQWQREARQEQPQWRGERQERPRYQQPRTARPATMERPPAREWRGQPLRQDATAQPMPKPRPVRESPRRRTLEPTPSSRPPLRRTPTQSAVGGEATREP